MCPAVSISNIKSIEIDDVDKYKMTVVFVDDTEYLIQLSNDKEFDLQGRFDKTNQLYISKRTGTNCDKKEWSNYKITFSEVEENHIIKQDPETIAAMFAEPLMGAGGVIIPPKNYFETIQPILDKYEIPLIDDEVICGFGRMGAPFASQAFGVTPDIMTMAKALTNASQPMGAIAVRDDIYTSIIDANATTLLVGIILYSLGQGPVKGFAVTLIIGIICFFDSKLSFPNRDISSGPVTSLISFSLESRTTY